MNPAHAGSWLPETRSPSSFLGALATTSGGRGSSWEQLGFAFAQGVVAMLEGLIRAKRDNLGGAI